MRWLAAIVSLILPATSLSGVVHALDYRKPPPPPPPIHDPYWPEPVYIGLGKADEGRDPCGRSVCGGLPADARPERDLQSLFTWRDYPADARLLRWRRPVEAALKIGPDGRVAACRVIGLTRLESLDRATCAILRARARFRPARDAKSMPAAGTWTASIR